MERNSPAADRALDAQCASERSFPSRIAVTKLKALSPADKTHCAVNYTVADLDNLLRCVLAAGIPVDTRGGSNNVPLLCIAAHHGSARVLKVLLAAGASHACASKDGWSAAHIAAYFGHMACLRILLDAGAPLAPPSLVGRLPVGQL